LEVSGVPTGWLTGAVDNSQSNLTASFDGTLPDGQYAWFNPLAELCLRLGKDDPRYEFWYNLVGQDVRWEPINVSPYTTPDIEVFVNQWTECDVVTQGAAEILRSNMFAFFLLRMGCSPHFVTHICGSDSG
jgi:hypothetical protein